MLARADVIKTGVERAKSSQHLCQKINSRQLVRRMLFPKKEARTRPSALVPPAHLDHIKNSKEAVKPEKVSCRISLLVGLRSAILQKVRNSKETNQKRPNRSK